MGIQTGRFRRSDRLLDSKDFRRVLRRGVRRGHRDLVLILAQKEDLSSNSKELRDSKSESQSSRIGITASRKVGNAVVRNRFKRRIRAWFRARRADFKEEVDLVVIARRSGAQLSFVQLDQRLSRLMGIPPVAESQPK